MSHAASNVVAARLALLVLISSVPGCTLLPGSMRPTHNKVILMIGDGMSDSERTSARNYQVGAAGRLAMDQLPFTGAYTTYAIQETDPPLPEYVVDSAASATAWSTGHKTSNGRLSTAPLTDAILPTILELAQQDGLPVGSVTTAELTDATPAALASHVNFRSCQGPADMKLCPAFSKINDGPGSVAEQSIDHHIGILLGGGRKRFAQTIQSGADKGKTVLESAAAQGYAVVGKATELAEVRSGQPILGLFAEGDMSPEWNGALATRFPGSGPQRCREGLRPENEPSLAAMTTAALGWLDAEAEKRHSGFFLQVEGASIDKRGHMADPCGQIGETVALDAAVAVVLAYADAHPDTLVIVTGDHAHTSQIVPAPRDYGSSPGLLSTLITKEGAEMTLGYATNMAGGYQNHTGTQVHVGARGPFAERVSGITDQTDLFRTMSAALGLRSGR